MNKEPVKAQHMTLRQYAAIHLRVPNSGIDWLDEMIRAARPINLDDCTIPAEIMETNALVDYLDGQWHEWNGGECPVLSRHEVVTALRNGAVLPTRRAGSLSWAHKREVDDIIRFRVVKS